MFTALAARRLRYGWTGMVLWKRDPATRVDHEATAEAYLARTAPEGRAVLHTSRQVRGQGPNWQPRGPEGEAPIEPIERLPWHRPANILKPARRRLARNLVIAAGAAPEVQSAYNRLRIQIVRRLQANCWNAVAVLGPTKGSGSSLTAINLAISLARDVNSSVLLADLDLEASSLGERLGLQRRPGLADYLLRDVAVQDILVNIGLDRLLVMPAGSPTKGSSDLISSPKMVRLVSELRLHYENGIILFDLPPALSSEDAMLFCPLVDCALVVVSEGETRVDEVRRTMDYLSPDKILGVVLNHSARARNGG